MHCIRRIALVVSIAASVAACSLSPYHLAGDGDGGEPGGDGGFGDGGGIVADAGPDGGDSDPGPDACTPTDEVCDGADNDCDGDIDEDFDLNADPANCGSCGNACSRPNMAGVCNAGTCEFTCLSGFIECDGDTGTGCETLCIETNGGVEACDFSDNDCDCEIDEGFDLMTDPDNCGSCGNACIPFHATPVCVAGECDFTDCDPGFFDCLSTVDGCEYTCPVPITAEVCNNVDDDCDCVIDEAPITGIDGPCTDPGFELIGDTGACVLGIEICQFGAVACSGYVGPVPETCDGIDNDCDGSIDENFDKLSDPRYCGDCTPCPDLPGTVEGCTGGLCTIAACEACFNDVDGDPSNGCEYSCCFTGPEVCDGIDNDCDMLVDDADPDLITPPSFCATAGACAGTVPTCTATACDPTIAFRCVYGGASEADACGVLPLEEAVCDTIDGDCDGSVDESFPAVGTACDDSDAGTMGACVGTGTFDCNVAGDDVECNITTPGAMPVSETCNNIDDDCNGTVDDGAPDDEAHVVSGPLDFYIYSYEASRPDSTASSVGVASHRACSMPGVQPWRSVSWLEANAACAAAGKRLCTEQEWQAACEGSSVNTYPYGDTYDPEACNGNDYDHDCTGGDDDLGLPTGTAYGCPPPASSQCVSEDGVLDMSGNFKEWTGTVVSVLPPAYRIRGGAFDSIGIGLTCQFDFVAGAEAFQFPNLGFRCCSDP